MNFDELKKIVNALPEREVRSYLYHIFLKVNFLECRDGSVVEFAKELKELYNHILYPKDPIATFNSEGNYKRVHILFGYGYLKPILKELGKYEEEPVIAVYDNFAVGPIGELHKENGQKQRFEWLKNSLHFTEEDFGEHVEGFQRSILQINSIPNGVPISIWISENAHEQTGLLFVLYMLKQRSNNISIINTAKLYGKLFKSKAKRYTPFHSGGIIPEELKDIYKYVQENHSYVTEVELNHFKDQWLSLTNQDETLRLWENRELKSVSEDYYDELIIEMAKKIMGKRKKKIFIQALRIIGEVYGRIDQYVGDTFLEYRLRKLIEIGAFKYEGSLEAMHTYSVKLI